MRVIPPLTITDAILTSSTVPEVASAEYNPATDYALNDTASVAGSLGLITEYKSLQAANAGHTPSSSPDWWQRIGDTYQEYSGAATYALGECVIDPVAHYAYESKTADNLGNALTDNAKWLRIGRTNRWAMFDLKTRQATISPVPVTIVLTPGVRCDSLGLARMVATEVGISVSSSGGEVYNVAEDLNTREVFNYYDYCFKPFSTQPALIRFDIPPYSNSVITITISATEGDVQVAAFSIGSYVYIGAVQYNAEDDARNFSTVERNFDGTIGDMTPRFSVSSNALNLWVEKPLVNGIRKVRSDLNAVPAFWSGLDDDSDGYFDALLKVGFYTQFKINLDYPEDAQLTLSVEEV